MDTSNLTVTLTSIDNAIENKKKAIELGEKLKRLLKDSDFKDVILGYCLEDSAKDLFNILTDPSGASPYSAELIHLKLEAISHLKGVLGTEGNPGTIMTEALQAPFDIAREEEYRKEVTADYSRDGEQ